MVKDIQMGLRLKPEFHEQCLKVAKEKGQSLAEWIRRAMQRELDREKFGTSGGSGAVDYTELDARIERVIERKLKEKNNAKNNQ